MLPTGAKLLACWSSALASSPAGGSSGLQAAAMVQGLLPGPNGERTVDVLMLQDGGSSLAWLGTASPSTPVSTVACVVAAAQQLHGPYVHETLT